jgi:hypothetical protein
MPYVPEGATGINIDSRFTSEELLESKSSGSGLESRD